jgi:predicted  nucleic acid-binding Zn-ribbon protein
MKRQREELSREIQALQKKPACFSREMEMYKKDLQNIERLIVALEQGQASGSTVMSSARVWLSKS